MHSLENSMLFKQFREQLILSVFHIETMHVVLEITISLLIYNVFQTYSMFI